MIASYYPIHASEPAFRHDAEWINCEEGGSCEDGEVWWQEYQTAVVGSVECSPEVPGCYDDRTANQSYQTSTAYYYWCSH
ncbi:MAG TPA: hypothetical protein VN690_12610 [Terriglobales bacterium]|nr:hypothetical protein [Terriglobales bacterium]